MKASPNKSATADGTAGGAGTGGNEGSCAGTWPLVRQEVRGVTDALVSATAWWALPEGRFCTLAWVVGVADSDVGILQVACCDELPPSGNPGEMVRARVVRVAAWPGPWSAGEWERLKQRLPSLLLEEML